MFSRWQFARYGLMVVYAVLACIGVGAELYAARDWGGIAAVALCVILFEVLISAGVDDGLKGTREGRRVLGGLLVAGALAVSPLPAFVCHEGAKAGLAALEHSKREHFEQARSKKLNDLNTKLRGLNATLAPAQNAAAAESEKARGSRAKASVGANFDKIYGGDVARQKSLQDLISKEQAETFRSAYPAAITWLLALVLEVVKFYVAFGIMCRDLSTATSARQDEARDTAPAFGGLGSVVRKRTGIAMGALGAMVLAPSAGAEKAAMQHADHPRPAVERGVDRPERSPPPVEPAMPAHRNKANPAPSDQRKRRGKVDAAMLEEVRRQLALGVTYRVLAVRFGIARSTLCDAVHRAERGII